MLKELLIRVADALEAFNLTYMIVGGQALLIFGEPRFTKDIDIILGDNLSQLQKVKDICLKLNLRIASDKNDENVKQTMVYPVIDDVSGLRIDFIFSFSDFEKNALRNALDVELGDKKIKYVSLEDLIIFKIFAARPVDLIDVQYILLKNPVYNKEYIFKWLKKFEEGSDIKYTVVFNNIIKEI